MRITSKGQVTIPADIRAQAGFLPHTEVDFTFDGDTVRLIRSVHLRAKVAGKSWWNISEVKVASP